MLTFKFTGGIFVGFSWLSAKDITAERYINGVMAREGLFPYPLAFSYNLLEVRKYQKDVS